MSNLWRPYGSDGPSLFELAQQALSSTDRGYDLIAARFDHTPFRTPPDAVSAALATIDDALRAPRPLRALDVCCGTGAGLLGFAARARSVGRAQPLELVGVDRSAGMLAEAQRRLDASPDVVAADPTRARFAVVLERGDALALPFAAASFDLACSFGAFGHILVDDEPRFVAELARVLAPGGHFVFITADPPPLLSKRQLLARGFNAAMRVRNAVKKPAFVMYYLTFLLPRARRLLEDAGFTVREHRGLVQSYVVVDAVRR